MKSIQILLPILAAAVLPASLFGQGMPPELRKNIHTLFDNHDAIQRKVELTEKGYTATTTSTNPEIAAVLKAHVKQMGDRLESGLMVRRWDPAFEEYVAYYKQLDHQFTALENGLKITVTGKTPAAVKVARNHAKVVSDFAAHGWTAHDRTHPKAMSQTDTETPATTAVEALELAAGCKKGECCETKLKDKAAAAPACCKSEGGCPTNQKKGKE